LPLQRSLASMDEEPDEAECPRGVCAAPGR
jgi:hypothetical protein